MCLNGGAGLAAAASLSVPAFARTSMRAISSTARAEAKRMDAKAIALHSSHMSLLSHPDQVAAVIEEAASAVVKGATTAAA
jgi:hypothetical protein